MKNLPALYIPRVLAAGSVAVDGGLAALSRVDGRVVVSAPDFETLGHEWRALGRFVHVPSGEVVGDGKREVLVEITEPFSRLRLRRARQELAQ